MYERKICTLYRGINCLILFVRVYFIIAIMMSIYIILPFINVVYEICIARNKTVIIKLLQCFCENYTCSV